MKRTVLVVALVLLLSLVVVVPAFAEGPPVFAGHQRIVSELKGGTAEVILEVMPGHVLDWIFQ